MHHFDYARIAMDGNLRARRRLDVETVRSHVSWATNDLLLQAIEQRMTHVAQFAPRVHNKSISSSGQTPFSITRLFRPYCVCASISLFSSTPRGLLQRIAYWLDPESFIQSQSARLARKVALAEADALAAQPHAPLPPGWIIRSEQLALDEAAKPAQKTSHAQPRL